MKRYMSAVCVAAFTMSPATAAEDHFGLDLATEYCVFANDDLDISDTATIGHIDVNGVVGAANKVTIAGSPHVFSEIRGETIILNPDPSGFDPPIALGDNAIAVDDFVASFGDVPTTIAMASAHAAALTPEQVFESTLTNPPPLTLQAGISMSHVCPLTTKGPTMPQRTMRIKRSSEPSTQSEWRSGGPLPASPVPDDRWHDSHVAA